ncbi:MAG: peptidase M3 [Myxococcaceae bacterium]
MASSLSALRDRLDSYLAERGNLEYRWKAGLSTELPLQALHATAPQLARPETFLEVREAVERKGTDDRERALLTLLLEFLASQVEEGLAAEAIAGQAHFEATAFIQSDHSEYEGLPLRDARASLPRVESRERRAVLERGIAQTLAERSSLWERRLEAAEGAARTLGFGGYSALRERVTGQSLPPLLEAAESFLRQTGDAYRDLLGYAFKKIDPLLKPSRARHHDLEHALTLPWMRSHFTSGDRVPSIQRWLSDAGFSPNAEGRIQLDLEERPGKQSTAFAARIHIPSEVRLVLRPGADLEAYTSALHEYGRAQHSAHVSRAAPLEERWLGDGAVPFAAGLLFDQLLTEETWHRRYLRAPSTTAKEAARMAAFGSLVRVRAACADLPLLLTLHERGATAAAAEEFAERQSAALGVEVPKGYFLSRFAPRFAAAEALRAWTLQTVLHQVLQRRFNEDYWRNPAAGSWLKALFSRGQRDRAETICAELGVPKPELAAVGTRLVRVMGA